MNILVLSNGTLRFVYDETLTLQDLGPPEIARASTVEPDAHGRWWADLAPSGGPTLGHFMLRSQALAAERQWLEARLQSLSLPHSLPGDA